MDMRLLQIPKITNDVLFESFIKDLISNEGFHSNVNQHGRNGQKQHGVDVFARSKSSGDWIGIQCKVRSSNTSFTKQELLEEINKAKIFNPAIREYYLYTTLSRDVTTQALERELLEELAAENSFSFQIYFWEDIEDRLRDETNITLYYRYYHKFFRDNLTLGHAIGKLMNLTLCFDDVPDTHCELLIGKIPKHNDNGKGVDYFRGTYFLINFHNLKTEFFKVDERTGKAEVFSSDIIDAINNDIDAYRICRWLRDIDNLDEFIYDDNHNYRYSITSMERKKYFLDNKIDDSE